MLKTLTRKQTATAADLLSFLQDLAAQGFDLSTIYVYPETGDDVVSAELSDACLNQNTLTDGSKTFDIVLGYGDFS